LQQIKFVYLSTGVVICLFTFGIEFTQQKNGAYASLLLKSQQCKQFLNQ